MGSTRDRGIAVSVVATDAAFLWFGRPHVTTLAADIAHPHRWVADAGSDGAVAALAQAGLWLCAIWVALAVLTVAASRLPGASGRLAGSLARHAVPAVIGRSIAGVVGASIFLAPLAAGAATPHRAPIPASVSVSTAVPATAPKLGVEPASAPTPASRQAPFDAGSWAWPTSPPGSSGLPGPPGSSGLPGPSGSSGLPGPSGSPGSSGSPRSPGSSGSQHADGDPVPAPVPWPQSPPKRSTASEVVVHRGDSLWAIAAHRLGPEADAQQISTASKQWYEANKPTIGSDPRLIHPGQHLHEPTEKGHQS